MSSSGSSEHRIGAKSGVGIPAASVERRLATAGWCLLALAAVAFLWRNLPDRGIWYDEGVQLFISLGQEPFGPLGQPDGGLRGVHAVNGTANLDPGGFSVLLFGWLLIDEGVPWARVLPVMFFALGVAALVALARRWSASPWLPLGGVALLVLDPLVLFEVTEVRAYTMELAGVIATVWAVDRFVERRTAGSALVAAAGISLAAVARYSGLFVGLAACFVLLLSLISEQPRTVSIARRLTVAARSAVLVLVPFAVTCAAIAVLSLPGFFRRVTYRTGELVAYLGPHLAVGGSWGDRFSTAVANLFGVAGLPLTAAVVLTCWVLVRPGGKNDEEPGRTGPDGLVDRSSRLVFGIGAATLAISVALWRYHPWEMSQKWSLYLRVLSLLCVLRVLAVAASTAVGRRIVALTVGIAVVWGAVHFARFERRSPQQVVDALAWVAAHPERVEARGAVAVGVHALPSVRYLCERDRVPGCETYPDRFALPVAGQPDPYQAPSGYVIAVEGLDFLRRRLAPVEVESAELPPNLYVVSTPTAPDR